MVLFSFVVVFNAQEDSLKLKLLASAISTKSCPSGGAISEDQQGRRRKKGRRQHRQLVDLVRKVYLLRFNIQLQKNRTGSLHVDILRSTLILQLRQQSKM